MKNKIIIAPLNWGLGHASRCVPIINFLILHNFTPVIASDGIALQFLKNEFPYLETIPLPSYKISYKKNLKWHLFLQLPKITKAVFEEHRIINNFVSNHNEVLGIISDNRFGVRSLKVPSVYITHQLNVLSGVTTFITKKIHQKIIKKFDECWILDTTNSQFAGKLSQSINNIKLKYIGIISRLKKINTNEEIDILVIISGPEPNRSFLEEKLISEFKNLSKTVVFVLGNVEEEQKTWKKNGIIFYNFLLTDALQEKINAAKVVVCRSGYSSIMDLAVLEKKVFFIPTKNQPEQEYLATFLENKKIAPYSNLEEFTIEKLTFLKNYKGFSAEKVSLLNESLFSLFHSK